MTIVSCTNCRHLNRVPPAAQGTPRCGNCMQSLPWIVDAGDQELAAVLDQRTIPVVVDLWAPWCVPSRRINPLLEQFAIERAGNLKLVRVNAETAPELSQRFNIASIPTLLVLREGHLIAERTGIAPATTLRRWLEEAIEKASAPPTGRRPSTTPAVVHDG